MLASDAVQMPFDAAETKAELRGLQDEDIVLALPALYVAAGVLVAALSRFEYTFHAGLVILVLLLLPPVVLGLRRVSYLVAAWALVLGSLASILLFAAWHGVSAAIYLASFPVGLAALFVSLPGGALIAAVCTGIILWVPAALPGADAALQVVALMGVWGTLGLIWLTRRPLLAAMQWYWSSYRRNNRLLEQARDSQVRLKQTLEDLADANLQLTRLNRLADAMRRSAEEARRAKEQFVANVSHELRTPLNMIVGFSEMILQAPDVYGNDVSPTLLADLEVVLRNSQHLARLVDDVLDLSQIETGQMALTRERASLAEIVQAAVTAVRPLFDSKGLRLEVDLPEDLPPIFCDLTRIRQVVLNLLSNAGRFTERGSVRIRAWQDGPYVIVSVADTGPGIAADALDRLFQPFQQLDGSLRRRYGGSGLGLSISKSFVELHGGRIWSESQEGRGTTFYFRLPLDPPPPVESGVSRWFSPHLQYETRTRPSLAPVPVLRPRFVVLESGQALQRLLERYLDGAELVPAGTLDQAVQELSRVPAQALLVNQASVSRALQELDEADGLPYGTPVIVCSIPGAGDAAGQLGVSDYLVKPISRDRLLDALDRLALKGQTVLIVDDEREALRLFRRMLASAARGYRVLRATDGRQALRILRQERPDAVLLDLVMPNMDGFRFLAEKNRDPALRGVPVIVTSARDPAGQLIVSSAVSVTQGGGLSVPQLLACIEALSRTLSPAGQASDPGPRESPAG